MVKKAMCLAEGTRDKTHGWWGEGGGGAEWGESRGRYLERRHVGGREWGTGGKPDAQ